MRKLKFFLALIAAFSLGEVVTVYRSGPNPGSFPSFLVKYYKASYVQGRASGKKVSSLAFEGNYDGAMKVMRRDFFPFEK